MDGDIDFTTYSDRELQEALATIDGSRFPGNLARLRGEIVRRGVTAGPGSAPPPAEPAVPVPPLRILNPTVPVEVVDIDAIPTSDQFTVFWGYLWRSLVVGVAAGLVGFLLSLIAGVFLGLLGLDSWQKPIGFVAGLGVGLALTWQFLRWLLLSRFGRYRFLLVRGSPDPP